MLVRYRGINNKGVLERPGTKWKVLRTISSTLKFQECQKSWKFIISLFGETENWRPGAHFDAKYVSAPFCHAKTAWIAIWSKKTKFGRKSSLSVFSPIGPLLVPYWSPICGRCRRRTAGAPRPPLPGACLDADVSPLPHGLTGWSFW